MNTLSRASALAAAMMLISGCSDDPSTGDELLPPPPTGEGVQYQIDTVLEPGVEAEHCKFVVAPSDGLNINRQEVRYTEGSHHFLLYETAYTEIPTEKKDGTPVDTSGVFDCSDGATHGWSVVQLVGGSQNPDGTGFSGFPPGVAKPVRPGAVLLMNAHYINTGAELLEPKVRINLFTIPDEEVEHEGDVLFWYNPFIKVGAQSNARARMRCTIHEDITLLNLQSHMHARGVGYEATEVGGELLYQNDAWENVPVGEFGDGIELSAGSAIDYFCDYNNAGMQDIYQGPRTTDEMCMLVGAYYPADDRTSLCGLETDYGVIPLLGADWVGNGDTSCAATLGCLTAATESETPLEATTDCLNASDPAISAEVSDALRCVMVGTATGQNAQEACESEIAACAGL